MKHFKFESEIIRKFFENIYLDFFSVNYFKFSDSKQQYHLLWDNSTYLIVKSQLENQLNLSLSEASPYDTSCGSIDQLAVFGSKEDIDVFINRMYEENRIITLRYLKADAQKHLEIAIPPIKESKKILSFDVESWERNSRKTLEVGISIYQSNNHETKHYIISENTSYTNGKYCADNRDNFQFGKSQILPLDEVNNVLKEELSTTSLLVLHNASAELHYLSRTGIEISIPVVDTQLLAYLLPERSEDDKKIGLTTLCETLKIAPSHMHNAGNDAYYTLKSMLAMVKLLAGL
jgi:hypothetical protein